MKAFFTGHRHLRYECVPGIKQLIQEAKRHDIDEFLVGMAVGIDQVAATVLSNQGLRWHAIIPCGGQDQKWSQLQQYQYRKLLKQATSQVVLYPEYVLGCFHARNKWMVERSRICLAVWDGRQTGGTWETIKMAISANKLIIQYDPTNDTLIHHDSQLNLF